MIAILSGANKQERIALLYLVVFLAAAIYLAWNLFGANGVAASGQVPEAVRDNAFRAFWVAVVGFVLIQRMDKTPLLDERDQWIKARGVTAGYCALMLALMVTGAAVGLDSYRDYVTSRSPAWLELYLMLCMAVSVVVYAATSLVGYWRDRR